MYGRTFTLRDPSQNTVGSFHSGPGIGGQYTNEPGMIGYNEVQLGKWVTIDGWTNYLCVDFSSARNKSLTIGHVNGTDLGKCRTYIMAINGSAMMTLKALRLK